ncbi:unnamed protein product [Meganyctiphanes norvegica]|uniref:Major facilitator superfamily (MFS) profile domain-containing protein n=1 Tax=Meganyctiphanes norvegica TaxID=48144 RepID=A0AAV2RVT9_MEGNR
MNDNNKHKQHHMEWRVPDGGWGWMIVVGSTLVMTLVNILPVCYGVMFSVWYTELGVSSTTIAVLLNINLVLWSMMSILVGPLIEVFGWRPLGMFSTFMAALAIILSGYATSILHLVFTYSILGGIFGGLAIAQILIILPKFFDKRLGVANAFPMAGFSICQFIFPILIPYLQEKYGFKGSMLILGGIILNSVVAAALFQPPEWHRIIIKKENNGFSSKTDNTILNKEEHHHEDVGSGEKSILKKICDPIICVLRATAKNFAILKKPTALIISLGHCLFLSSTINFIALLPFVVINAGYSMVETGWIMSYAASANITARLSSSMLSDFTWFKIPIGYVCGTLMSCLGIAGFALTDNILHLTLFSVLQGFGHGSNFGLFNLVTKEIVGVDNHSASIGSSGAMLSMGFLTIGPLVGLIRDSSGSYTISLFFIAVLNALSFLLWLFMPYAKSHELKAGKEGVSCNDKNYEGVVNKTFVIIPVDQTELPPLPDQSNPSDLNRLN